MWKDIGNEKFWQKLRCEMATLEKIEFGEGGWRGWKLAWRRVYGGRQEIFRQKNNDVLACLNGQRVCEVDAARSSRHVIQACWRVLMMRLVHGQEFHGRQSFQVQSAKSRRHVMYASLTKTLDCTNSRGVVRIAAGNPKAAYHDESLIYHSLATKKFLHNAKTVHNISHAFLLHNEIPVERPLPGLWVTTLSETAFPHHFLTPDDLDLFKKSIQYATYGKPSQNQH